jgi:hypothetical protein
MLQQKKPKYSKNEKENPYKFIILPAAVYAAILSLLVDPVCAQTDCADSGWQRRVVALLFSVVQVLPECA